MALLDLSKSYRPFAYPWEVELTKKHEEIHWVEDEAELSEDVQDWKTKLSEDEKDSVLSDVVANLFKEMNNYNQRIQDKIVGTVAEQQLKIRKVLFDQGAILISDKLIMFSILN